MENEVNYIVDFKGSFIPCNNLIEVLYLYDVSINKEGQIFFEKKMDLTSYNMEEFTPEEALLDFAKYKLPKYITIYKVKLMK
jgi:hypothetical protein